MSKLEHYLDQVCRSIGGPRSLRQHVRQELREHLLDAAAEHKAAGFSEAAALDRALEDFGGPEQVRAELEATHGYRLMSVVIDKAMQWKERTMKAKWLWTTWAYLAAACVVVLEVLFITFNVVFIVPKFQMLMRVGIIDSSVIDEHGLAWTLSFLSSLQSLGNGGRSTLLLLLTAAVWGFFEWRVRSENKPFMRLSALGTAAVGLMVVVALTTGSLVVLFCLGAPPLGKITRPFAQQQVASIESSIRALEQALAKRDWEAMQDQADRASQAMSKLVNAGPAIPSLALTNDPVSIQEVRTQIDSVNESLLAAQKGSRERDEERVKQAIKKFHEVYASIAKAAARE